MNIIAEPQNITEVFKSSDLLTTRARGRSLLTQEICLLCMTCINAERGLKTTTTTTDNNTYIHPVKKQHTIAFDNAFQPLAGIKQRETFLKIDE